MRIRMFTTAAALALAVLAPSVANAGVCYSVTATVNGDAVVQEASCI